MEPSKEKQSQFVGLGLTRFGISVLAAIVTFVYVSAAINFEIRFYLPIGVIILSLYSWIVTTKLPTIYPSPTRPIIHLLLVFAITGFSQHMQFTNSTALIEAGNFYDIHSAATYHAYATIALVMVWLLLIYLGVVRYKIRLTRIKNKK
jgi:hypothetical protein